MNVDIWTKSHSSERTARMKTAHQDDCAVLVLIDVDGNKIAMFGPFEGKDAFDKMAALFNEALAGRKWINEQDIPE